MPVLYLRLFARLSCRKQHDNDEHESLIREKRRNERENNQNIGSLNWIGIEMGGYLKARYSWLLQFSSPSVEAVSSGNGAEWPRHSSGDVPSSRTAAQARRRVLLLPHRTHRQPPHAAAMDGMRPAHRGGRRRRGVGIAGSSISSWDTDDGRRKRQDLLTRGPPQEDDQHTLSREAFGTAGYLPR